MNGPGERAGEADLRAVRPLNVPVRGDDKRQKAEPQAVLQEQHQDLFFHETVLGAEFRGRLIVPGTGDSVQKAWRLQLTGKVALYNLPNDCRGRGATGSALE